MSKYFLILVLLFSVSSYAKDGNEGTGGGDPIAIEFTMMSVHVGIFINHHPVEFSGLDMNKMNSYVRAIRTSVSRDDKKCLVEVVETRPKDANGVEKAALFNRKNMSVKIHRQSWQNSTMQEKVTLVAMELLGQGEFSKERYLYAGSLGKIHERIFAEIAAFGDSCTSLFDRFVYKINLSAQEKQCKNASSLNQEALNDFKIYQDKCARSLLASATEVESLMSVDLAKNVEALKRCK